MPHGCWMRTLAGLTLASSLLAPQAFAQFPVSPIAPAPSVVQVGVAGAVQGVVQISSGPTVGMLVESGRPIYLGDVVTTGAEGRLQVLLLDETVFTVGPNSSIVIDEFVYDPATSDGKITAQVLKGAFRFVTGKIAHKKPENMKVNLPAGTIGVRGTIVVGRVEGSSSLVALLGPGPDNNAGARVGRIEVSNPVEGQVASVMVTHPGFGTTIPGVNLPPTLPALVPPEVMQALQHDLSEPIAPPQPQLGESDDEDRPRSDGPHGPFRPDGQPDDEGAELGPFGPDSHRSMTPPSPEHLKAMLESGAISEEQYDQMVADINAWNSGDPEVRAALMAKYGGAPDGEGNFADYAGDLNAFSQAGYAPEGMDDFLFHQTYSDFGVFDPYAAVNEPFDYATYAAQTAGTLDGVALREQLTMIQTGTFHFIGNGFFRQYLKDGAASDIPGTMHVQLNIDFGSRTIGGGNSSVNATTTANGGNISAAMAIAAQSFNNSGLAIFKQTTGPLSADFAVKNVGGAIGAGLDAHVTYNTSLNAGEGGMFNIPRQDGTSP